jgi:Protein of unknown function (DUF2971)
MLAHKTLFFQSPAEFNDPFDCKLPLFGEGDIDNRTQEVAWEEYRKKIGVFCLSCYNDDIVLWSHYADKHKGVVLAFDGNLLANHFVTLRYVQYRDRFLAARELKRAFESYQRSPRENKRDLDDMLFFRKWKDWTYEGEWRIIVENPGFYPWPDRALTSIILGCKRRESDVVAVREYLEKYAMQNVKLFIATECPEDYCVKISPVGDDSTSLGDQA